MILKLISLITGRRIVLLEDMDGEIYKTIENKSHPFTGKKCAYVYWLTKIRLVQLEDGGTVTNGAYIKRWKYA